VGEEDEVPIADVARYVAEAMNFKGIIYMYICIHICVYTYIYVSRIYMYIDTFMYIFMFICVYVHIFIGAYR
jgi:hypothetical protein